jgi:hypothetical protein
MMMYKMYPGFHHKRASAAVISDNKRGVRGQHLVVVKGGKG